MTSKTPTDFLSGAQAMTCTSTNTDITALRDKLAELAEKAADELKIIPVDHIWPLIERLVIAMHHPEPLRRADAVERFFDDIGDFICDARDRLRPDYGERHPSPRRLRSPPAKAEPARIGFNATLRDDGE